MSVNDVVELGIKSDSKQSNVSLPQLDEGMLKIDCMNDIPYAFMDQ